MAISETLRKKLLYQKTRIPGQVGFFIPQWDSMHTGSTRFRTSASRHPSSDPWRSLSLAWELEINLIVPNPSNASYL